jgi:FkbM family methyltransferase
MEPFQVLPTKHGQLIASTLDDGGGYGVGYQLMQKQEYDGETVKLLKRLIGFRRQAYGDGVVAVDCGANIGVFSVEMARHMLAPTQGVSIENTWGSVISIEAQERIYYALAGNLAINNLFNARAIWSAVGSRGGTMRAPMPDYTRRGSYGSFELRQCPGSENIGQQINKETLHTIPMLSLDLLKLPRLDVLKIDVEGMENEVLDGAHVVLDELRPIILAEVIKCNKPRLLDTLKAYDYFVRELGMDVLAIHKDDKVMEVING